MGRSSKWIGTANPQARVSAVARQAIRERLRTVWDYAPLAAKQYDEDIEYVHQLRVATRRTRAALQVFGSLLPKKKRRWMKEMLCDLRQAAGEARDLDVLHERLGTIAKKKEGSHLGSVVQQIAVRRQAAQKPLVQACKHAKRRGFKERSRHLARAVRWRLPKAEPTFAEAAATALASSVDRFFTAAQADLSNLESLHAMRIAGKQLRYGMELLAAAFDDSFRGALYSTFTGVQEKLGTINDHATAITTFNEWCERSTDAGIRAELADLIAHEEKQLDAKCRAFHVWWTAECVAELAQQFADALQGAWTFTPNPTTDQEATPAVTREEETAASVVGVPMANL